MVPQKHSPPGRIVTHANRDKSRPEKSQPGERTAAQIRFENEQSHERISQIDKVGRHHSAPQGESADSEPNAGNLTPRP
jgi:hypothetical protein